MPVMNAVVDESAATSWGAIVAGAVASLAVTIVLIAFGVGAGLTVVSPWSGEGVSSTNAARLAGLYLIAVAMLSSTVGGFVTGRLRAGWLAVHEDERYFRDTAHGFLSWALATLLFVAVLGSATSSLISGVSSGAGGIANAASRGANPYVERLLRNNPSPSATQPQTNQTSQGNDTAMRADVTRVFTAALRSKDGLAADDRTYLGGVVASRAGVSQQEGEQRVDQAVTQAKQAADTARKTGAKFAFWLAASLLAGALFASLAATVGGWLRSSSWWETEGQPVQPAAVRRR